MNIDINQLKDIVITSCQAELLPRYRAVRREYKSDGSIVTKADLIMQQRLTEALADAYPDIAFLGEEMSVAEQEKLLKSDQALWCVDPIDGTSNFAAGLPFFCVSIALIVQQQIILGLVYDPIREECFTAQITQGAYLNGQPLQAVPQHLDLRKSIALIDFKRLPTKLSTQLLTHRAYSSQRNLGAIALEMCWIAAGRCHIYLHGRQQLWDYAAAQLILTEAGAQVSTLEGQPLYDGHLEIKSTIAATDQALFEQWSHYLSKLSI